MERLRLREVMLFFCNRSAQEQEVELERPSRGSGPRTHPLPVPSLPHLDCSSQPWAMRTLGKIYLRGNFPTPSFRWKLELMGFVSSLGVIASRATKTAQGKPFASNTCFCHPCHRIRNRMRDPFVPRAGLSSSRGVFVYLFLVCCCVFFSILVIS